MERPVKKHQELNVSITDLAFGGAGIAHVDDFVIFVKNAIPGQQLTIKINKVKNRYAEASILNILAQSPEQQPAPCPYFTHCGGCRHQHLAYPAQLRYLHNQVQQIYRHLGSFHSVKVLAPLAAKPIYRYRNKMEFAFSNQRWLTDNFETEKPENFALGLRAAGNFAKALDLDDCLLAPQETSIVLEIVRKFALQNNLSCYNQKSHTGFLRHLVIRKAQNTSQLMINIVTNDDRQQIFQPLVNTLAEKVENLSSIVNTISRSWSGTTFGESQYLLYGKDYIIETLGKLAFKISPTSFFQTNTVMAKKLCDIVKEYAGLTGTETVWDFYCGTGSIALYLADRAREVIGFEIINSTIKDACENARLNHLSNVRFIGTNLDKVSLKKPDLLDTLPRPDVLIIDPPRAGMHAKLVDSITQLNPTRIVYVSCNPTTQVRDIRLLLEQAPYRIDKIQPLDLFPHTPHIEVVTKLERIK